MTQPQNVVIYARTASVGNADVALADQIARCRSYVAASGWQEARVVTDIGVAGTGFQDHPAFVGLLGEEDPNWDIIVVADATRLSRDPANLGELMMILDLMGIGVHAANRGEVKLKRVMPGFRELLAAAPLQGVTLTRAPGASE